MVIVIEGIDGSGTTTQAAALARLLSDRGAKVRRVNEPSDGPIGAQIRQILRGRIRTRGGRAASDDVLALLFAADRLDLYADLIGPSLDAGEIVVSDRSWLSSVAYQGARLSIEWVEMINKRMPRPDYLFYLDISVEEALARLETRDGKLGRERYEDIDSLKRTRQAYEVALDNLERDSRTRVIRVEGALPAEEISEFLFAQLGLADS